MNTIKDSSISTTLKNFISRSISEHTITTLLKNKHRYNEVWQNAFLSILCCMMETPRIQYITTYTYLLEPAIFIIYNEDLLLVINPLYVSNLLFSESKEAISVKNNTEFIKQFQLNFSAINANTKCNSDVNFDSMLINLFVLADHVFSHYLHYKRYKKLNYNHENEMKSTLINVFNTSVTEISSKKKAKTFKLHHEKPSFSSDSEKEEDYDVEIIN